MRSILAAVFAGLIVLLPERGFASVRDSPMMSAVEPAIPLVANYSDNPQIRFSYEGDAAEDAVITKINAHKKECESQGPGNCRVLQFASPRREFSQGSLKMLLNPAIANAYIAKLMSDPVRPGVNVSLGTDQSRSGKSAAETAVEKQLLIAERDKLRSMENSPDRAMRAAISRKLQNVESQIARLESLDQESASALGGQILTLTYSSESAYSSDSWSREARNLFKMFILSVLTVIGIALLTSLYFGLLGFLFLKLRRIAIKLRLIKPDHASEVLTPVAEASEPRVKYTEKR